MTTHKNLIILKDLFFLNLLFFIISLPLSTIFNSISIISLLLLKVLMIFQEKSFKIDQKNKALFYSFFVLFLLYLFSLFWSNNIGHGLNLLEKRLSFLAFPVIFLIKQTPLTKRQFNTTLLSFSMVIFIACLYTHFQVGLDMLEKDFPISKWNSWWYTSINLSGLVDFHPTYMSIYITLAIVISYYFLLSYPMKWYYQSLIVLASVYLLVYNLLLSSRLNMLLSILIFIALGSYFLKIQLKSKLAFLIIFVCLFSILLITISRMPYLKSKFTQSIELILSKEESPSNYGNSTSSHLNSWLCSLESIDINSFLLGHGLGDSQSALLKCYDEHNFTNNLEKKYNAHNEILQIQLDIGFVGVCIIVLIFYNPFGKHKMIISLFLLILIVSFLSESILSRQKGIVFFTFFLCFFNAYYTYLQLFFSKQIK